VRNFRSFIILILSSTILFVSCQKNNPDPIPYNPVEPKVSLNGTPALKWSQLTLNILHQIPFGTPTFNSRALGYIGLTMYETVVNSSSEYQSVISSLNMPPSMPVLAKSEKVDYTIAMNAGQAFIIKNILTNASEGKNMAIDTLEAEILKTYSKGLQPDVIERSVKYGKGIALAIYEWSKTDGGHEGYKRNFDPNYKYPAGNGKWIAPVAGQVVSLYPLHPYWGQNRTFALKNSSIPVPQMTPYSQMVGSDYYKMYEAVYKKSYDLSQTEKEIAAWWGDDPTESFSPPGHSFNIAVQIVAKEKPDLVKSAATFAHVGMAVADAFINCWKAKYTYHCERPSTYIRRYLNGSWVQFWPEPPFPAFYSGHSVQGSSAATVLEDVWGKNYAFTDSTHFGRPKDVLRNVEFKVRKFQSLREFSNESGISRIYGGIHTELDNTIGLDEGLKIGTNINELPWKK
jgi:PAP2 superfamily